MPLMHGQSENMRPRGRCILAGECLLATKRRGDVCKSHEQEINSLLQLNILNDSLYTRGV